MVMANLLCSAAEESEDTLNSFTSLTRSPHDWLSRFCVRSSGNPHRNNGFRRECYRCHLAKGEAFKAKSENREPPTKSTKESANVAALEKKLERYRQAEKKSESPQQETDAPTKAAYTKAIRALGDLQTTGLFADDHPAIKTLKAGLDQAKAASDESVPLSKRIPAGQIAMHLRDLKAANDRVQETEQSIVVAQQSLEQHRAKVVEIEKSLQERRNHLEQLHRQAAAEASHGAEATQLQILVPDGVTKHLPQEARDCLRKAADLYEEERKAEAAAKEAAARPAKEAMELDEFGDLDDREVAAPDPAAEARIDEILQAQIRGDPERLTVLRAQMARDLSSPVPKEKPKQG